MTDVGADQRRLIRPVQPDSAVAARDFGNPATIASSDAPIALASAAAEPPPGVGSGDWNASSN